MLLLIARDFQQQSIKKILDKIYSSQRWEQIEDTEKDDLKKLVLDDLKTVRVNVTYSGVLGLNPEQYPDPGSVDGYRKFLS